MMQATLDECFVVFVREDRPTDGTGPPPERELVSCPTYEEALWVRREYGGNKRNCIIRYVGPSGGGD